jgi:hypothetical protein
MPQEVLALKAADVSGNASEDACLDLLSEDPDVVAPQFMTSSGEAPDTIPISCGCSSCYYYCSDPS